jgi:hypothetical protein
MSFEFLISFLLLLLLLLLLLFAIGQVWASPTTGVGQAHGAKVSHGPDTILFSAPPFRPGRKKEEEEEREDYAKE